MVDADAVAEEFLGKAEILKSETLKLRGEEGPLQMLENELRRGDGLGMITGGGEWGEVAILGDDVFRACGDRAIGEFVVVRIRRDELKAKSGADMLDIAAGLLEEVDETQQLRGGSDAHFPCGDFFVFQKNLGRDGPDQPAIDERLADG